MVLLTSILVLAATVLSIPLVERVLGRNTGWYTAAVLAALTALVAAQAPQVLGSGEALTYSVPWMPQIGVEFHLRMDTLGWKIGRAHV